MFENHRHEEPEDVQQLPNGTYTARIVKAEPAQYTNGNSFCKVTVEIQGFKGYVPNTITLNEIPVLGAPKGNSGVITEEDVKRANQSLSRFCECFKIDERYISNLAAFAGHVGTVDCNWQYDAKEPDHKSKQYKQLFPKVNKQTPSASSPTNGNTAPAQGNGNSFPEDIPF